MEGEGVKLPPKQNRVNWYKIKDLFSIVKEAVSGAILSEFHLFQSKMDCSYWLEAEYNFSNVLSSSVVFAISRTIQGD